MYFLPPITGLPDSHTGSPSFLNLIIIIGIIFMLIEELTIEEINKALSAILQEIAQLKALLQEKK